ncbi:hypothetical protein UFOVP1313_18 [uncultured Caudovirales phage]|uniref:Uncharacterized protein n=1 Tax=uncultured Caudovirales phage TaxID=2100421 RepID=A0A6J5RVD7_9CAUD|nr:hypothetical protein UFOVP1313_18 [uncultured Caudovirales phage]
MVETPHFAYPFELANGKVSVVEQDTAEHVMACENVIVRCPVGFRVERPEFGWPFPEFRQSVNLEELETALQRWEPRSTANAIEYVNQDASTREITVEIE